MKRLIGFTGIIIISCVLITNFFAPVSSAEITEATKAVVSEKEDIYIIKGEDNRIVVYRDGESVPFMKTDTIIDSLPECDKIYLKNGIEISGKNNLRKALEDYCS